MRRSNTVADDWKVDFALDVLVFSLKGRFSATFSTFYVADFRPWPIRPSLSQVSGEETSLGHVERCEFSSTDTYYPVDYFDKLRN